MWVNLRGGAALSALVIALAVSGCAAEPAAAPPVAGTAPEAKPEAQAQHHERHRQGGFARALAQSLNKAQEALKEGRIDAAAYERIVLNHQRMVATMAAIEALGWGNFPTSPPGNGPTPRPPTRVEAIERLTEMLNRPEPEEEHRRGHRR